MGEQEEVEEARQGGPHLWSQENTRCGLGTAVRPLPLKVVD